jgi:hypothetical protein
MTVIGLGEAGCNIAEKFEGDSGYKVKLIDVDIEGDNCFALKKQQHPEDYEKNFPDISKFLSDCDEYILFFVGGGGDISGATLKLLNYVKDRKIYVAYIRPDRDILGSVSKLQDNLVFNVLQEYTRSGVFLGMILISNNNIETIVGDNPVVGYFDKLNTVITNSIVTLQKAAEKIAVYDNYSSPKDISCISTYGVYDLDNDIEKLFYDLEYVDDKCYYFFINKTRLETDGDLFKKIKNSMKKKAVDKTKISYIIHSTDSKEDFCYITACTSKIQK